MINRECGVYQTTYEGDMALYPAPLAELTRWMPKENKPDRHATRATQ